MTTINVDSGTTITNTVGSFTVNVTIAQAAVGAVVAAVDENTGADLTGATGSLNRVLTLSNTTTSSNEMVFIGGLLVPPSKYTANHLSSSSTITFLIAIYDAQDIVSRYHAA